MQIVSDIFRDSGFAVFANILKNQGTEIKAIPAPGGGSRNFCDRMNSYAQKEGLPGMGYIFWREVDGKIDAAGPLAKNIGEEKSEIIRKQLNLNIGDAAFFLGGKPSNFDAFSARARIHIGNQLNLLMKKSLHLHGLLIFLCTKKMKRKVLLIFHIILFQCLRVE